MYRERSYTGTNLPLKTFCLTYDDGPGENTLEIAEFLADNNIRATFFVVGKYAVNQPDVLEKLSVLGHLIGNHTYEHPDMPYYLSQDGDIVNQVLRTDAIIKKYITNGITFFRSPYGKWSKECANELNLSLLATLHHIGPIHWDVGGVDCFFWKQGKTVDEAVEKYLADISNAGKGIIVMHDNIADMEHLKKDNHTLQLTRKLIPLLKKEGYEFVRLDEIESLREAATEDHSVRT